MNLNLLMILLASLRKTLKSESSKVLELNQYNLQMQTL